MAKKKVISLTPAHMKFCEHYCEYDNMTMAYLFAYPGTAYGTAKSEGSKLMTNHNIIERVEQLKEEFATQFNQTKEKTTRDLIMAAEEAKTMGQFASYATLRNMIIKMCGFYAPTEIKHSGDLDLSLKFPNLEIDEDKDDGDGESDQEDNA